MEENEIKKLLLNQAFHKLNMVLKWWAEDTKKLAEETDKATLFLKDFTKAYKQACEH